MMNRFQTKFNSSRTARAITGLALLLAASASYADGDRFNVSHAGYQQECSSCHVAYPPQMLSAASWRAVMGGLDKHFDTDASLDKKTHSQVLRFLQANAGKRSTDSNGKPLLRITETRWFIHEHSEELPHDIWKHPDIKTPANCQACHTSADKGDYSERSIRLPKGARK